MKRKETMTDERIIELYFSRDEIAISVTDEKYGAMLYSIAYNILHNELDCEECKNDTYLGVWNAIPPARPNVFPAFITQIIKRIAINRYKEKNAKKRIPSEFTESIDELANCLVSRESVSEGYEARELGRIINDYVSDLPERRQYIFIGKYYMAQTPQSLADELSVGIATVYRELDKIKEGLREHLERNGVDI